MIGFLTAYTSIMISDSTFSKQSDKMSSITQERDFLRKLKETRGPSDIFQMCMYFVQQVFLSLNTYQ